MPKRIAYLIGLLVFTVAKDVVANGVLLSPRAVDPNTISDRYRFCLFSRRYYNSYYALLIDAGKSRLLFPKSDVVNP